VCLDNFKRTRDEATLVSDLRNISQNTIDKTLAERGLVLDPATGAEVESGSEDEEESESEEEEEDEATATATPTPTPTATATPDEEDSQGGMMSIAVRQSMFPLLVTELVKSNIMDLDEGQSVLSLFKSGDDVLHAALDVYDVDSDMAELVDTLKKTAVVASLTSQSVASN
jgi:hypothetical protein